MGSVRSLVAMATAVVYCGDPLSPRRVDQHFAEEAEVVRGLGGVVARIDHDALLRGDVDEAVARVSRGLGQAWYRGWMVPSGRYGELADALTARGCRLVVSAAQYRRAHELPGWYPLFAEVTPRSVWLSSPSGVVPSEQELASLVAPLGAGPGVVKDYVKSRKHEWDHACYVPDLVDSARLHRVVSHFVELQDEFLSGGIVVRAFERFAGTGPVATEARVWWVGGEPVLEGPHPDTPAQVPQADLRHVAPLVRALGCPFVTTDLAQRADGAWRVIEVGDGQVSDLPRGVDASGLVTALLRTDG